MSEAEMAEAEMEDPGVTTAGRDDHRPFLGESHVEPLGRLARFVPRPAVQRGSITKTSSEVERRDSTEESLESAVLEVDGLVVSDVDVDVGEGIAENAAEVTAEIAGENTAEDAEVVAEPLVVLPEQFHQVKKGELEDVPRVYVFVHGWLPGSRETADTLFAQQGAVTAWDERVSNTAGRTMISSYSPLLSALAERDPEAAVLWFSWVDQSSTDSEFFAARDSFRNTEINGRRLAMGLQDAFGDGQPKLHILGHSHGCVVATHASLSLGNPPRHLTLLDCPEDWFSRAGGAAGLLDNVLPRLQPDRGDTPTFVDTYSSMFGRSYHGKPGLAGVVDVRLTPRFSTKEAESMTSQAHQYAVEWYAETVADKGREDGYGWSPVRGFDTSDLSAAYLSSSLNGPIMSVASYKPAVSGSANTFEVQHLDSPPQSLGRGDPDLALIVKIDPSVVFVEFDYDIKRAGRNTTIEVATDRQLRFVAAADVKVPGRGRYLRLAPYGGEKVVLQFRVRNPGMLTAVAIQRIRVVRGKKSARNYDDIRAVASIAVLGALAGSAATLGAVGAFSVARRLLGGATCEPT